VQGWREAYRKTRNDQDSTKLVEHVLETEGAIFVRLQELNPSQDRDHDRERAEIQEAVIDLLKIKTERLGWPDPAR
jgi:hypothetical protein